MKERKLRERERTRRILRIIKFMCEVYVNWTPNKERKKEEESKRKKERERKRKKERERKREKEKERERKRKKEKERERKRESLCVRSM